MPRKAKYLGYECSTEGCEKQARYVATGYCDKCHIMAWRRRQGVRTNAEAQFDRRVNDGNVSYKQAHIRVKRHKGPASEFKCVDCGVQAQQWSYLHNAETELTDGERVWSANDADYAARCVRHHKAFDRDWRHRDAE